MNFLELNFERSLKMNFADNLKRIYTIRCKSEPFLLYEERLRICERNRGHGISRDLSSVLLNFWDFKHIPYMDDRSRDAVRVCNHRPFRSVAVEFLRDTPETIPLVNSMSFKSIIGL